MNHALGVARFRCQGRLYSPFWPPRIRLSSRFINKATTIQEFTNQKENATQQQNMPNGKVRYNAPKEGRMTWNDTTKRCRNLCALRICSTMLHASPDPRAPRQHLQKGIRRRNDATVRYRTSQQKFLPFPSTTSPKDRKRSNPAKKPATTVARPPETWGHQSMGCSLFFSEATC
jgi:hypothetical protein